MKTIRWRENDALYIGEVIAAVKDKQDVTWVVVHLNDGTFKEIRADTFEPA